jgi:hypothetical protein
MRVMLIILTLMLASSSAYAACYTNARGRLVCNDGQRAGGGNANRGTARTSETNEHGVTTTQTSGGGEVKSKNGKGVYTSPSGKNCYKSANGSGCR